MGTVSIGPNLCDVSDPAPKDKVHQTVCQLFEPLDNEGGSSQG